MIIFAAGCSRTNTSVNVNTTANGNSANSNTAVGKTDSTPTNTASPTSAASPIEQKATAIVGKWETTTALNDKIMFDFSPAKKEVEAYAGTYTFYVNDSKDTPAKYIVSSDKMIKFFTEEGKEYPLIKVSVSDDGKTLTYFDQKGGTSKLTRVTGAKNETAEIKADCEVKKDNVNLYVEATDKDIKLKKGTPISWTIPDMHQGIIVVKAKVGSDWSQGEIKLDDTTCN